MSEFQLHCGDKVSVALPGDAMTDDEYLDQLQEATEQLLLLLKDRQPGLKTWWIALMKARDEVLRRAEIERGICLSK